MKSNQGEFSTLDEENKQEEEDILTINEEIEVKELAPRIFAMIRNEDKIDNGQIKTSLSPEFNRTSVFKAGEGSGKSGSFFFFSHDKNFIIKTMNDEEYKTFSKIFKNYYSHILHHKSLIARIYGVFSVKRQRLQPVHLILMGNTVKLQGKNLKYMFDLKGSFINRKTKMKKIHNPSATLKDVNLIDILKNVNILKFTSEDKQKIISRIKQDVPLLASGNIMDYSLLLAIEENPDYAKHAVSIRKMTQLSSSSINSENKIILNNNSSTISFDDYQRMQSPRKDFEEKRHTFLSSNLQYIYHIAIIDYLQDYNFDKKLENFVKTIWRGRAAEISAVPPERYAKRYIEFMENQVILLDKKKTIN